MYRAAEKWQSHTGIPSHDYKSFILEWVDPGHLLNFFLTLRDLGKSIWYINHIFFVNAKTLKKKRKRKVEISKKGGGVEFDKLETLKRKFQAYDTHTSILLKSNFHNLHGHSITSLIGIYFQIKYKTII